MVQDDHIDAKLRGTLHRRHTPGAVQAHAVGRCHVDSIDHHGSALGKIFNAMEGYVWQPVDQTSPTTSAPTAIVGKVIGKGSHETPRSWLQKMAPLSVPA